MLNPSEVSTKTLLLNNIDFFSCLSPEELEEFSTEFAWHEYAAGTVILQQGQDIPGFNIMAEGKAESVIDRAGTQPLIKKILGPGDSFGEDDLFVGKPSAVTVRCLTPCRVLSLNTDHFAYMLIRWPDVYRRFTSNLHEQLSQVNVDLLKARYREFVRTGLKVNRLKYEFYGLLGSPETTAEVQQQVDILIKTKQHALFIGERGTGHQMMAWFVHKQRYGEAAPFVFLEAGKMDKQKGNPFYEIMDFPGKFAAMEYFLEVSEGGTLFIKDINLLSPRMQDTLAKALESKSYSGWVVGSLASKSLLDKLLPRLKSHLTFQYTLQPLRKRKQDILFLAQGVLEKIAHKNNQQPPVIDEPAKEVLLAYTYRDGNVSELIRIIERAFFLSEGNTIGVEHLFLGRRGEDIGRSINLLTFTGVKNAIMKGIFPDWLARFFFLMYWIILGILIFSPDHIGGYSLKLIWGLWWPFTAILAFWMGRIWCSVCPFSVTMELFQKIFHLNHPVPNFLKKYDYLFITFLFLLFPWLEEVTAMRENRISTALWLLGITAAVAVTGIIFTRHTWCRHLCPLGGFIGMASLNGMIEVRADAKTCLNKCTTHDCYRGTSEISGCPMSQHTAFLDTNNPCKLCFRCVRTCHRDAVKVNLRVPAREVWHLVRVNQGFTIFLGTGLAVLVPMFLFQPYYHTWPAEKWRFWFSIGYWGAAMLGFLLMRLLVRPFSTPFASRRVKLAFALVPILVAGHVVYQINFIPGIQNLSLSLGFTVNGMLDKALLDISIHRLGQVSAAAMGLLFTLVSVIMVIRRSKKRTGKTAST